MSIGNTPLLFPLLLTVTMTSSLLQGHALPSSCLATVLQHSRKNKVTTKVLDIGSLCFLFHIIILIFRSKIQGIWALPDLSSSAVFCCTAESPAVSES